MRAASKRGAVGASLSGGMLGGLRGARGRSSSTTAAISTSTTAETGAASNGANGAAGDKKQLQVWATQHAQSRVPLHGISSLRPHAATAG